MDEAQEIVTELQGKTGRLYRLPAGAISDRPTLWRCIPLQDSEELAFVAFPHRLLNSKGERLAKEQLVFGDARFNGLKKQVSCPVDVAYRDNEFAGLIVSYMHGGIGLEQYLDLKKNDRCARRRTAHNLCVLAQIASRLGCFLGRMSPERILVNPSTCRVFLAVDYAALAQRTHGLKGSLFFRLPWQGEVDLALHVYCLLNKRSTADLERRLWSTGDCSGLDGPSAEEVRSAVFGTAPRSVFASALSLVDQNKRLRGIPRQFRRVLESGFRFTRSGDAQRLSMELCAIFELGETTYRGWFSLMKDKLKQLMFGARVPAERVRKSEQRPWGLRGYGSAEVFWATTMWMSVAIGACSAVNGFAPFDMMVAVLLGTPPRQFGIEPSWLCIVIVVAGSALYNLFVAQRHPLLGYERHQYCFSLIAGTLLMTLVGIVRYVLLGGAL